MTKLLILSTLILGSCSALPDYSSKFSVGDCLVYDENEFIANDTEVFKVLKVGEKKYLLKNITLGSWGTKQLSKWTINEEYHKITCPEDN